MNDKTQVITPPQFDAEWMKKLADSAKETQANERMESNYFSTKAGVLSFGGVPVTNNRMSVIVLCSLHENAWYEGAWDPANPKSPECWAFSETGKDMAPVPALVGKPQAKTCDECPKGAWGSGLRNGQPSKGKACKQGRRLSLLSAGSAQTAEGVVGGIAGILRVPVMSVKNWSQYANKLALLGVPPFAAFTEVSCHPDQQSQFRLEFSLQGYVTDAAVLEAITKRIVAEKLTLATPYGKNEVPAPTTGAAPAAAGQQPAPKF